MLKPSDSTRRFSFLFAAAATCATALLAFASAGAQDSSLPDDPSASSFRLSARGAGQASHRVGTASLAGAVQDSSGAVVGGAHVSLKGPVEASGNTDPTGHFTLQDLTDGRYTLTVSAAGLASFTEPDLQLGPHEHRTLPTITLSVAGNSVSVNVTASEEQIAAEQVHAEEKQRVFGIFPSFYTSYTWDAAPLDAKQKFALASHSAFDPVGFIGIGIAAGIEQANNTYPAYKQGAEGYAKRYGAGLADESIGRFFSSAIYPSLFHQDPRYFFKGTGTRKQRALYAITRTVITRGNDGREEPNYSLVLGRLTAGAIANSYHPAVDRGVGLTFGNAFLNLGGNALDNLLREFFFKRVTPNLPTFDTGEAGQQKP